MTDAQRAADPRSRIIEVAARLLREEGTAAVTTRGVARGAGLQAPAIYRLFGDKDNLLNAVVEHEMSMFFASKAALVEAAEQDGRDAVSDLRESWTAQIDFGLNNPQLFRLMSDPARSPGSPARDAGQRLLEVRIRRVATVGRLRVTEQRAVGLIMAAGIGVVSTLLATSPDKRDAGLADAVFEGVLAQILLDKSPFPNEGALPTIVAFRATAPDLVDLTRAERLLLGEWLDRVIAGGAKSAP